MEGIGQVYLMTENYPRKVLVVLKPRKSSTLTRQYGFYKFLSPFGFHFLLFQSVFGYTLPKPDFIYFV